MRSWNVIQQLKLSLRECKSLPSAISIVFSDQPQIFTESIKGADLILHLDAEKSPVNPLLSDFMQVECGNGERPDEHELSFLKLYLPYVFLDFAGRKEGKCFAVSHFAQTLDGRIATSTGDSKWIGNEENLLHAHRMRALCDAILVGSKTIQKDNPKLTVRLVKGLDPVRVIIGGNSKLSDREHHAIDKSTIVFSEAGQDNDCYKCVVLKKDPYFDLKAVLNMLVERELYSVYVEGGSFTTSRFIEQKAIDQIQIHFSAKILGSGTHSFGFGSIENIKQAITFKESKFIPVGDEMMFIGNL